MHMLKLSVRPTAACARRGGNLENAPKSGIKISEMRRNLAACARGGEATPGLEKAARSTTM